MVIICDRTFHKAANYYVMNVCFADLIICAVIGPYNLYTIIENREIAGCEIMGTLTNLTLITSITSLTAVAVNRYYFIKLPLARYSALYKHYKLAASIILIWLISVVLTLPLSLTQTRGGFDESLGICVALLPDNTVFTYFYQLSIVTVTGLPAIIIMLFCYYKIYKIFKQSIETVSHTQTRQNNSTKDKYKLIRNLFIITILFTICWVPEFITTVLDFRMDFPALVFQITGILAQSNSIINPFTYVLLNKKFFNVLVKILTCNRKCCFKTVRPPIGGTTKLDDSPTATIQNVSA
ncbi:unnamed protein product [Owenia fusiformis]|uniref:G-protein coupled receptors family 1 profile domain-containing protein n=1 Tax=Owenia fusiformis TaxID=6347 RepID=A0A8S4PYR5_OWEFU|nr:unnamed protein product [Owenia fusiformis]